MTRDLNLLQLICSLDQQVQISHYLIPLKSSSQRTIHGLSSSMFNQRPSQTSIDGTRYGECKITTGYFPSSSYSKTGNGHVGDAVLDANELKGQFEDRGRCAETQVQQLVQRYAILVNQSPNDEHLKTIYQLSDEQLEKSAKGRLKQRLKRTTDVIEWWNKQYSAVTTIQKRFERRCSFARITFIGELF